MKKLSMFALGATVLTLGMASMSPAKAANLTRLDYQGTVDVTLSSPLGINQSFDVNQSITVDNLSGRLKDEGDAELTIDNPLSYLGNYLGSFFSNSVKSHNGSLNFFVGRANISHGDNFLSSFDFFYQKDSDVFTVKGYDFDKIKVCLIGTCLIEGQASSLVFVSIPMPGMPGRSMIYSSYAGMNFNLRQTATPIAFQTETSDETLPLPAETLAENPQSVPEPATLLGLMSVGGLLAATRKSKKAA